MAQHDYDIANQTFPSFRSDLNSVLEAINTSNSGTSRPSSAVAGTVWLDVTNATNPTLKFFDGTDDISLAQFDYSANTVNWLDSTVVFDIVNDTTPQLGGDLDVNGNDIVSVSNGNITFTPDGTGKVVISGLSFPTSDGSADQLLKTDGSGNLSFTDIISGISWQSVKTASFTAVSGEGYLCNTTSSAFTVTFPSSANIGDSIQIVDYAGTFETNNLTVNPNGNKIQSSTSNRIFATNRLALTFVYVDATQGWTLSSGYKEESNPFYIAPYSIEFLVVAGGGGSNQTGNLGYNGGGGAGGYRTSTQTSIPSGNVITVTVGDGGSGANGSDSSVSGSAITNITSTGGGFGATYNVINTGGSGGSGGGATFNNSNGFGSGNTPSTSPSQGNNGGTAPNVGPYGAGGGGGASQVGQNGGSASGHGGDGTSNSITGTATFYAGGGGGGRNTNPAGDGGDGGGADGNTTGSSADGVANTGGGAGGQGLSGGQANSTGGKGVVILSVPTASYSGTTTGSPTVTTSGSNTIIKFTGSGSYTT